MSDPLTPVRTAAEYDAERDPLRQINSMGRIVQIGPFKFTATATDWPDVKSAEEAASRLAVILNSGGHVYKDMPVNDVLDQLGEAIRRQLDVDDSRPYGMTFIAEPV